MIICVLLVNATIGFIQETKANRASTALQNMLSSTSLVLREGIKDKLDSTEVVIGDIIIINSGDRIPADCRLLEVNNFATQEAPLTGETTSNPKTVDPLEADKVLAERTNMVYSGTVAMKGNAVAVVIGTSIHTEIGKISTMVSSVQEKKSPLTQELDQFGQMIVLVTLGLIVFTFLVKYLLNRKSVPVII